MAGNSNITFNKIIDVSSKDFSSGHNIWLVTCPDTVSASEADFLLKLDTRLHLSAREGFVHVLNQNSALQALKEPERQNLLQVTQTL